MLSRLTHSRAALILTTALVTATLTGGIAWAVISPVSSGVVHGCYNPATGGLQLKVTSTCPTSGNKSPINWNVQGVKGTTGATGPAGQAPVENVTWNASVAANAPQKSVKTNTTFGAGAALSNATGTLTGNFTSCTGGFIVGIAIVGSLTAFADWNYLSGPGSNVTNLAINGSNNLTLAQSTAEPLDVVVASCYNSSFVAIATPAFSFQLHFTWAHPTPKRTIT